MRPGEILLDRYRLERQLGAGGFGVVYLATQLPLGRPVAVKVLSAPSSDMSTRFAQEAALAQRLDHPHTVRILDFGFGPMGAPFIVWEFLKGQTLGDLLASRGFLPPGVARRITVQILKSLMEAHGLGIIHRDIKPANIFVTSHPGEPFFVKVLDFGIAKDMYAVAAEQSSRTPTPGMSGVMLDITTSSNQTRASQLVGTPRYMAPEQAHGQPVGPDTDLYAVGLVLCEMLTGRQVYGEESGLELLLAQGSLDPAPIPPAVAQSALGPIIVRATQKTRALRFSSAAEMIGLLEGVFLQDDPPGSGAHASGHYSAPFPSAQTPSATLPSPQKTELHPATPPPRAAKKKSSAPLIAGLLAIALAAGGVALAFQQGYLGGSTKSKTKAKAKTTETSAPDQQPTTTGSEAPFEPKDPFELPPPPKVDWSTRKVPAYTDETLKAAVTKAGWQIRKADNTDTPNFKMVTLTVSKPPCGGAVLYYQYADEHTASQAEAGLKDYKGSNARVIRNGLAILHVALATVKTPEGNPACYDPLAVALTE